MFYFIKFGITLSLIKEVKSDNLSNKIYKLEVTDAVMKGKSQLN